MRIPAELLELIGAQDGLVTRHQALALGMSPAAVRHALSAGARWQRLARGVYATFTGPLERRHYVRAALLCAGPAAVVTGGYACRAYGLRYAPYDPLTVLVPAAVQRAELSFAQVRRTRSMPQRRWLRGFPVASPDRAVLDACHGQSSLRTVRATLCEAVQAGLTTRNDLTAALGNARWRGSKLVRLALGDLGAGCRSAPECELRDLVRRSTFLPEPAWNQPLPGNTGVTLIPDACWREARVVVEVDSAEWHRQGDRVEQTERRRARYAALGWVVLSISPRRLRADPAGVLAEIEAAVKAGLRSTGAARHGPL